MTRRALSLNIGSSACRQLTCLAPLSGAPGSCAPAARPADLALVSHSVRDAHALLIREESVAAGVAELRGACWWEVVLLDAFDTRRCESDARVLTCSLFGLTMDFADVGRCFSPRHMSQGSSFFLPEHLEWHGRRHSGYNFSFVFDTSPHTAHLSMLHSNKSHGLVC